MRKFALVALACLGAAACTEVTTGTVSGANSGAVAGARVAGPVGAAVGGTIGATTGAVAGATVGVANAVTGQPGRCYATDRNGNVRVNRAGEPLTVRC